MSGIEGQVMQPLLIVAGLLLSLEPAQHITQKIGH
jgi:hypothetical protein